MGLFDAIQNILGGASDAVQGPVGDIVGGLADIPGVQEIQDLVGGATDTITSVTDGATEAVSSVTEQGQTIIEDITNKLGL
jgi:phage-related protein